METLHPGLYLQEVPGENPIEGVSTSTGAFVGATERGPVGKSGFVTSWKDFQKQYGGYIENSYLPYAVRGFFENGGTRAFISRAVHFENQGGTFVKSSAIATYEVKTTVQKEVNIGTVDAPQMELQDVEEVVGIFDAFSDGTWGNDVKIEIANGKEQGQVTITVYEDEQFVEKFENIPLAELDETINASSTTIKYTAYNEELNLPVGTISLVGGLDGLDGLTSTDYIGDEALQNGLYAFENDPINIVAIPGITDVATHIGLTTYVEKRKDCTAIIEAPYGMKPLEALEYANVTANIASARVAIFYSWIQVADPIGVGKNPTKYIPPSGHVMGVYARTDNTRGVWKAPAGLDAVVRGAIGLEYNVNDAEQDMLNPDGINAIRAFDGEGIVIWGSRTRASLAEWKYIAVRRSADFVGQSILAGTRWAVFEPNDQVLWGKITAVVSAFLRQYWRVGGLRGTSESEAFFVECNSTTTTPDDIDVGKLYCNIGICPQKPAEFVIFRLSLLK